MRVKISISIMSELIIKQISTRKELIKFIRFNYELYKDSPYAVPDFLEDTLGTFDKKNNAAFDFCEAAWFIAERDKKMVGRVCAIINNRANKTWNKREVRFGWIDFIDDSEVSAALLRTVEQWGKERGMTEIVGPLGFTDMDPEGMLIEGFEELGTMATIYNYPYYPKHMERLGFVKDADWCERLVRVPDKEHPADTNKFFRVAKVVEKRYKLRYKHFNKSSDIISEGYGRRIFDLINEAYAPLYGFSQMTPRQCDQYVKQYIPFVDPKTIAVIVNEKDEIVATGIGITSLSHAIQKAKARLFPFGWWHMLKAIKWKRADTIDLLLVAVRPDLQGKGVNAMVFADLIPRIGSMGYKYAEVHPILEDNHKSADQWDYVESRIYKRRRSWKKEI